ncbi:alkaline phosphatase family protein [Nocardia arthritidis]|uniref:Sulfatase-like hydrolase/transferase n=1 Tax=Nocardia arthritidis TaxID=228602 RepID=A0A6G9YQY3_9NOCA|nr:alkaline phosphatase family protein [Nocardia arthritidis]QIS15715.1 sulfatase-like hydrolase/transferase [Nocardia arthritidis]
MNKFKSGIAVVCACAMGMIASGCSGDTETKRDEHVLLLSIDGMHQSDLAGYVRSHPDSALAKLVGRGASFTNAQTPIPSDSFPGLIAAISGGNPKTTGVYYDDTWARDLLPAGTTNCADAKKGTEVSLTEDLDKDQHRIDAGQGLTGLPDGIGKLTGDPSVLLDPAKLPVAPASCKPLAPNEYLKVNTVFSVLHAAGKRTAWSDKHPAYVIANGKGGRSIDDLFTPEINSAAPGSDADWTKDNQLTRRYDAYKVDAVVNEIAGKDHSGAEQVGVPAIFGMNFQSVSTAQKLPASKGYLPDGKPGELLSGALDFVDQQVGRLVTALDKAGLTDKTSIILTAKHGQSPIDPSTLTRVDDKKIVDAINTEWAATHPGTPKLVAHAIDDSAIVMWLTDRSADAAAFVKRKLLETNGTGTDIKGDPKPYTASGVDRDKVYAGADAAKFFGVSPDDPRVPDIYAGAVPGTVYTGGKSKIAEHGGMTPDDRHVPIVVAGKGIGKSSVDAEVSLTQIAPTILRRLDLDPNKLDAVAAEHTAVLPGL